MPDFDTDDIVKVVVSFAPQPIRAVRVGTFSTFVTELQVGASFRIVSLEPGAHGGKIEVKNGDGDWIEQIEYTET